MNTSFDPGPVYVRFVLEKVALEQVFRSRTSVVFCKYNTSNVPCPP